MPTIIAIAAMLAASVAAGLLGSFALMRRMTLAADSLSHVALPGIALALLLNVNPVIGGFVALVVGALIIWGLERKTKVATEALIGVLFAVSLAIGALLSTREELLDILFGNVHSLTAIESMIGFAIAAVVISILLYIRDRLTISILSPSIAATMGINNARLSLVFLILFAAVIMLGLKFLGVLLMGSLIIIPAAAAKNIARNLSGDLIIAPALAVAATAIGLVVALRTGLDLGPVVVCVSAGLFLLSLFFAKKN